MDELLKNLIEQRAKTWEQGKAILDRMEADGANVRAEDEEQWQKINAELDTLDARIDQLTKRVEGEKRAEQAYEALGFDPRPQANPRANPDSALIEWMRAGQRARDTGETVPKAFEVSLSGLFNDVDQATGRRRLRDMSTADQNVVPTGFVASLYEHLIENSAVRQTPVQVFTTQGGGPLELPKTVAHPGATMVSEGGTIPSSQGTIDKATLSAYKYGDLIKITSELLTDEGLPTGVLVNYLARSAGQAIANAQGEDFVRGTGSSMPEGMLVGATHVGRHVGGTLTADDLIQLQYAVIEPYARNGWWFMSRQTAGAIRRLKDGNGSYVWAAGLGGAPNTILDRPYVTDPNWFGPATASSATQISFGDPRAYAIRDVASIRFERSDDFAFDTDEVAFRILMRSDGAVLDATGAIKHLTGATY